MQREIKFRGLRTDGKGWVYGYVVYDSNHPHLIVSIIDYADHTSDTFTWHDVIPESVSQFTGLKDRNGKDIYEGDRLKHNGNIFIVKFSKNQHVLVLRVENDKGMNWRSLEWPSRTSKYCEIIGNIHEQKTK